MTRPTLTRQLLSATTALSMFGVLGLVATPAFAQDAGPTSESTEPEKEDQSVGGAPEAQSEAAPVPVENANVGATDDNTEIVVTGSLFRRTNTETPSPVTVLNSEALARRGITNVSDAVRSISADSSGSIPNAFAGGFGAGASAPALRGLTVNSTLTVVDGLRMPNYALSDDGQRAFVDLNTLPRVALERIEVLKDGASSTYGADAIGGVVNLIMRKNFNGVDATIEGGITERGDGEQFRATVLAGWGDYDSRGLNFYVGGEYERNENIWARDRGFPFNTADLENLPGGHFGGYNQLRAGGAPTVAVVRRATQAFDDNLLVAVPLPSSQGGGIFDLLSPAECVEEGGVVVTGALGENCEQNPVALFDEIQPKTERFGVVARGGIRISDSAEAYMMGSWYRSNLIASGRPTALRTTSPIGTLTFVLPNYICPDGNDCANDPDRELNPYNPYASETGDPLANAAQLYYRFQENDKRARFYNDVFRLATGVNGTFSGFDYQVDALAAFTSLRTPFEGISLENFTQLVRQGRYNFFDPDSNPQEVTDLVVQKRNVTSTSSLQLIQGILSREVAPLGGGPLQVAVGAQFRRETQNAPDANPTQDLLSVNQANAQGQRNVWAAFYEISAPVIDQVELLASGRYDHYSTGFSAFSPKFGFKVTPIPQIALRGTWSKGFRAPSFQETSGEITGFVTYNPGSYESACESHGGTFAGGACVGGSPYVTGQQPLGFNNASNPDLDPERSRSWTLGTVLQPLRWLSLTFDYYNIVKKDIIVAGPLSNQALENYYAGLPLPAGYSVELNPIDPEFPGGIRTVNQINGPYANAASIKTTGFDISALLQFRISPAVRFSSNFEATRILKFNYDPGDGSEIQEYVGTQGPYILSSGAGTPKWRANWSNSIDFGRATLTATAYYVSGYKNIAEDISGPNTKEDCANAGDLYDPEFCRTKSFTYADVTGSYKLTDNITIYGNILNVTDEKAPINPPNYAATNYNPTYTQAGAVGRAFRIGANFSFRPRPVEEVYVAPPAPPPPPPAAPATITCPDGLVIMAGQQCPAPPPPPPPPPPAPERGQ